LRYIIVDLEATCWEDVRDHDRMEIIEIGAVEIPESASPHTREFNRFIKPVSEPQLSEFCRNLTSIRQHDVDTADYFGEVFHDFIDWIGDAPFVLCSWGGYDLTQFRTDCHRHGMTLPSTFESHINLKKQFASVFRTKVCGMERALAHAGLLLDGTHHRGIDDARNIAKLANLVLPSLEAMGQIPEPRTA
jgi:3'-5' exoribonuclease 1